MGRLGLSEMLGQGHACVTFYRGRNGSLLTMARSYERALTSERAGEGGSNYLGAPVPQSWLRWDDPSCTPRLQAIQ